MNVNFTSTLHLIPYEKTYNQRLQETDHTQTHTFLV